MQRRSVAFERTPRSRVLAIGLAVAACGGTSGSGETSGASTSSSSAADTTAADSTSTTSSGETTSESSSGDPAGSSEGSSSTGGEIDLAGNCAFADHVGGFAAVYEPTYSAFSGSIADGVVPLNVLEQVGADGSCTLWRRNNPFCDPGCAAGETCDFDGNCLPYPAYHDVGVVTVTGLEKPVMLDPVPPTFSYFDTMLPHPGFEPGALITLATTGGDYSPVLLHGIGVEMVVPAVDEVHLERDTPIEMEWTPGDARTTLRLQLAVDQHGTSPLAMICSAPADAGTLTISGELVTEFLDSGISGFPSADFFFETVDSVDIEPGCVDFVVRSRDSVMVWVQGHTPCNSDPDCPKGQTCDVMN
ncbi:MAG: hypothetical protein IAG13_14215, partial [Deltaproteobacteria bacterium]|nr:hypothetical protein [Nannocystaceae bacterium]